MRQYDFACSMLRAVAGKGRGGIVAQMSAVSQNTFFQVIGVRTAAQRFDIMVGLQDQQRRAGESFAGSFGNVAGVCEKAGIV